MQEQGDKQTREKKLEEIHEKYLAFLSDVSAVSQQSKLKANVGMAKTYGGNFAQLTWNSKSIDEAMQSLKGVCPSISEKLLKRSIQSLMIEIFEEQYVREDVEPTTEPNPELYCESLIEILDVTNLKPRLQNLIHTINETVKSYKVFVPIEGIKSAYSNLKIRNIHIYSREHPLVEQLLTELNTYGIPQYQTYIAPQITHIDCYGVVDISGNDEYVREMAINEVHEAIKILNFSLSSSIHRHHWQQIRMGSVIFNKEQESGIIGCQEFFDSKHSLTIKPGNKGHITWLEILLSSQPQSKLNSRILQAISWYSKAVDADSAEESFVNLAIALESLLIDQSENNNNTTTGSINQKLQERVAFLLKDSVEDRKSLAKNVATLYGQRSGIVHSGKTIEDKDLIFMDNIVRSSIMSFSEKKFGTWSNFMEWLAQKRYG